MDLVSVPAKDIDFYINRAVETLVCELENSLVVRRQKREANSLSPFSAEFGT